MVSKTKITSWWDKKVEELSKDGAKVQFITTVLHEPQLLIFDEPFNGFDPVNTELIKKEILALKEKVLPSSFLLIAWNRLKNYATTLPSLIKEMYFTRSVNE